MNFDDRKARLVLGLRRAGVTDRDVMAAMEALPRVRRLRRLRHLLVEQRNQAEQSGSDAGAGEKLAAPPRLRLIVGAIVAGHCGFHST